MIYEANLSFKPNIGKTYYLYQKHDDSHLLSLVSPKEWGKTDPSKNSWWRYAFLQTIAGRKLKS